MWPKNMRRNNGSKHPKCGDRHEILDSKSSTNLIQGNYEIYFSYKPRRDKLLKEWRKYLNKS